MHPTEEPKHILIVEDALDLQILLTRILLAEGYNISKVANGREALDFLNTCDHLPSMILLDLMMPVMDGFEFRQRQRQDPRLAMIPVVVMSADSDAHAKARTIDAADFIPKGLFDIDTLLSIAARHTSNTNRV